MAKSSLPATFSGPPEPAQDVVFLAEGAVILRGFAVEIGEQLTACISAIAEVSPFRHLMMANGLPMAIAITNCGSVGWVSSASGYHYSLSDPVSGQPWPEMPPSFRDLAIRAAQAAGFEDFNPNVCIVNRYTAGTGLRMHQDRDETTDAQPVVSVSLGLPAQFRFGGQGKGRPVRQVPVEHGDVAVWGGPSRMAYHGVVPLQAGTHPTTGDLRLNLTFRTAKIPVR